MTFISRFGQPESLTAPDAWVLRADAELWADVLDRKVGSRDLAETVPLLFSYGASPQYSEVTRLVSSDVEDPGSVEDCTGLAVVNLPTADNLDVAEISWVVRPDRQGEGIGSALYDAAVAVGRERSRTKFWAFTVEPVALAPDVPTLAASAGQGEVDATSRETRFLVARGFRLNQVERTSMLELPPADELARVRDELRSRTSDAYECLTFSGPAPDELLEQLAELNVHMSTDVPTGGVDAREIWDADRVRTMDQKLELADREQVQTLVRHVASNRLVGFTRILKDRSVDHLAHQWETLVIKGHRGHGLGMLAKVTNHAAVGEHWPTVKRLSTGNATENQHMLAINIALGFQPHGGEGFWIRTDGTES